MTNIVKNKNGIEFDIDAIATDLNGKMDRDGVNAETSAVKTMLDTAEIPYVVSRTKNGIGTIEIWSDGFCVQTGYIDSVNRDSTTTINLPQAYVDTNYVVFLTSYGSARSSNDYLNGIGVNARNTTSFVIYVADYTFGRYWRTEGYIR